MNAFHAYSSHLYMLSWPSAIKVYTLEYLIIANMLILLIMHHEHVDIDSLIDSLISSAT
jgi:hypothetical protein